MFKIVTWICAPAASYALLSLPVLGPYALEYEESLIPLLLMSVVVILLWGALFWSVLRSTQGGERRGHLIASGVMFAAGLLGSVIPLLASRPAETSVEWVHPVQ